LKVSFSLLRPGKEIDHYNAIANRKTPRVFSKSNARSAFTAFAFPPLLRSALLSFALLCSALAYTKSFVLSLSPHKCPRNKKKKKKRTDAMRPMRKHAQHPPSCITYSQFQ
jgi:hypothetical protein